MKSALYLVFVLSGAAGLFYEAVWSRYLALFVGHSAYAQVLVIGTFLGGMALGALAVGQRSRRLARPLLWYAGAEVALAVLGLAFDPVFRSVTDWSYGTLIPALAGSALVTPVKWGVAMALILPASVLLGTTFPLMSAGVLRVFPSGAGRTLSNLYFVNSLGAAMGVLLAGFVVVAAAGLPGTLVAAALLNVAAGGGAYLCARGLGGGGLTGDELEAALSEEPPGAAIAVTSDAVRSGGSGDVDASASSAPGRGTEAAGPWRLLLGVSFLTAVASFVYEIGWIRMLSLVMGSATHSFEIMLSAFILGLALGAREIRRWADRSEAPVRLLGWIQWAMGLAAVATLPLYVMSFDWMAELLSALATTPSGYALFNLARYGLALVIMVPSTFMAGMTLPLITTILLRAGRGESAIGWVYGVNTLGSIVGVGLAGLVLLPWLGLKGMLVAGALLDMAVGVFLLARSRQAPTAQDEEAGEPGSVARFERPTLVAAGATAVAAVAVLVGLPLDRAVLTSGVYRYAHVSSEETRPILFYADGRTATVGAYFTPVDSAYVLTTNGKPDASLTQRWIRAAREPLAPEPVFRQDETTQILLALLGLAHHPRAGSAAVIGQGSGITGHYLLGSPHLAGLTTVELEPEMMEGSRVFYPANRRVFDDPRSRVVIADAKAFFAEEQARWDIIVSEPSNPWVSGTASLFTEEFYGQVHRFLAEDGVFVQWIHLYELEDGLVGSVLAALHRNFPDYRAYLASAGDLVVVAGRGALPDADWAVFAYPDVASDLSHLPPFGDEHLRSLWLFDRAAIRPLMERWAVPNSDYYPVLDLQAERARYLERFASGVAGFSTDRFQIAAALTGRALEPGEYAEAPVPGIFPMWSWARGAWLRAVRTGSLGVESAPLPPFLGALHAQRRLDASLASDSAPVDWQAWMRDVVSVEAALHGRTAGAVGTALFPELYAFMNRWSAPDEARSAVAFLEGLATWDFARVAAAAPAVIAALELGRPWLSPAMILDASVVAFLRVDDVETARRAFTVVVPRSGRASDDFRVRLLEAWIQEAEEAGPATTP